MPTATTRPTHERRKHLAACAVCTAFHVNNFCACAHQQNKAQFPLWRNYLMQCNK